VSSSSSGEQAPSKHCRAAVLLVIRHEDKVAERPLFGERERGFLDFSDKRDAFQPIRTDWRSVCDPLRALRGCCQGTTPSAGLSCDHRELAKRDSAFARRQLDALPSDPSFRVSADCASSDPGFSKLVARLTSERRVSRRYVSVDGISIGDSRDVAVTWRNVFATGIVFIGIRGRSIDL